MIPRENVRRQLALEEEGRGMGIARYEKQRPSPWQPGGSRGVKEEADLPPGKLLLREVVQPMAERIREWLDAANSGKAGRKHSALGWMEMAEPEAVAYVTTRAALNAAVTRSTFQAAALGAAEAIISHVEMVNFQSSNLPGYRGLLRAQQRASRGSAKRQAAIKKLLQSEGAHVAISHGDKTRLGTKALELLVEATGLFERVEVRHKGRPGHSYGLGLTEAAQRWLDIQHGKSALFDPLFFPMIIRPRRWRSTTSGGYLGKPGGRPARLVKGHRRGNKTYDEKLRAADLEPTYEALNHIQETSYRINRPVLRVMEQMWEGGGRVAGLPPREDHPLPARPHDIDTNPDALARWKRRASEVYEANSALTARRLEVQQRLWVGRKFEEEEAIWFPHSVDWRGRVYPAATVVHPQADSASKSLLEFAVGKPLGARGAWWFKVHIANLFGIDKVPFEERVAWVDAHAEEITDSGRNPLDGNRYWATAEKPWQALAASIEFAGWLDEGDGYVSRIPIALDGSNSGLQHYSAMLRDPVGAAAVNVTPSDRPQDVYRQVADVVQRRVDADPSPAADPWRNGKVRRKVAKRPTMTFVYSATRYGMTEQVLTTLEELDAEGAPYLEGADNFAAAAYLGPLLFDAVGEVVVAASGAMAWLRKVADVASRADLDLEWTAPDGFRVVQSYRKPYGLTVETHWLNQRMELLLELDGESLDKRGQSGGVAPNFVHSLDAAHLRAVARGARAAGIDHLAVIHDSFGTHAADTDRLSAILRQTFVDQYQGDVLHKLRDEIVAQLPPALGGTIPPPPPAGPLDVSVALRSVYLFA